MKEAVIVVDMLNDFFPGGTRPIPAAPFVLPFINMMIESAIEDNVPVVYTQEFYPAEPRALDTSIYSGVKRTDIPFTVVQRGSKVTDSGSSVFSEPQQCWEVGNISVEDPLGIVLDKNLHEFLQRQGIDGLIVVGLATDGAVLQTVLDARKLGYAVHVQLETTAPVEKNNIQDFVGQMLRAGATVRAFMEEVTLETLPYLRPNTKEKPLTSP